LRAGRLSSGCGGLPMAGSLGARHLAGEAAVGLAEALGQIRRGAKSQGAGEADVGFFAVLGGVERHQGLGQGVERDRVAWGCVRRLAREGQGTLRVVAHQLRLAEGAEGVGVARGQGQGLLQGALGAGGVTSPQGCNAQGHQGIDVRRIERHSPLQQPTGLHQLALVAFHHPQLGEALQVVGLELAGGFQERDESKQDELARCPASNPCRCGTLLRAFAVDR